MELHRIKSKKIQDKKVEKIVLRYSKLGFEQRQFLPSIALTALNCIVTCFSFLSSTTVSSRYFVLFLHTVKVRL